MEKIVFFILLIFTTYSFSSEYDFDAIFSDTPSKDNTSNIVVDSYMKQAKKEQEKIIEQERARERALEVSRDPLADKCAILIGDFTAYKACMKDESAVFGRNLNAYYAIRHECQSLAGNDDTGLSYLCQHPNPNGCVGLKASQSTINACYNCGGSNLWLRVYATGHTLQCY